MPSAVDHPRSRGVYPHLQEPQLFELRIIPARAGFTSCRRARTGTGTDHPRSRGVYPSLVQDGPWAGGIIPARAGFTSRSGWRARPEADHPRSRGVYGPPPPPGPDPAGSSPLARGLRHAHGHSGGGGRIIPARAGFTRGRRGRWASTGDHPRSRGVYKVEAYFTRLSGGSSPLARGLHNRLQLLPRRRGIIPARAGFTGRRRRPP